MNHHIYIASTLSNAKYVQKVRDTFASYDVWLTYDWTRVTNEYGSLGVPDNAPDLKKEIAEKELDGIAKADAVLVILPGGGGTHFEMAFAYSMRKPIVILNNCIIGPVPSFYFLNGIVRCSNEKSAITTILDFLSGRRYLVKSLIEQPSKLADISRTLK